MGRKSRAKREYREALKSMPPEPGRWFYRTSVGLLLFTLALALLGGALMTLHALPLLGFPLGPF